MKGLHLLFAAKLVAIAGLGGFMYANHQANAEEATEKASDTDKNADSAAKLPDIPEKGLSLSRAAELRNQLLLMRKDVEQKIEKMNIAKQGYERAKGDVDAKLKRIEEERKLLEETLQKERKAKDERLSETLEFIAKMEPKKAAPLIEGMDRDLVMQLLRKLPPRQVTKLLESVNPKKATELLEYYTRIRSGREYELLREMGLCANGNEEGSNDKPNSDKNGTTGQIPSPGQLPGSAPTDSKNGVSAKADGSSANAGSSGADANQAAAAAGSPAAKSNEPTTKPEDGSKEPAPGGTPTAAPAVVR
jgi:flagellar motility protein MotE (MotC chaperone)